MIGRNKYHNRKYSADGEVFDSKREYQRWQELKLLEKAGEIAELRRQVPFELLPNQREPDKIGPRGGIKTLSERRYMWPTSFIKIGQAVK